MRNLAKYVLSAGILALMGYSDVDARSVPQTDTVAYQMLQADPTDLMNTAKELSKAITSTQKSLSTAATKIRKQTLDLDTFSVASSVAPALFISQCLNNVAASFETIALLLTAEADALKNISKSKKTADKNSVTGKKGIKLSVSGMRIASPGLASVRAHIALVGKLLTPGTTFNNAGAIGTLFADILKVVDNPKKKLTDLANKFEAESNKITADKDVELKGLFKLNKTSISDAKATIDLLLRFINSTKVFVESSDISELEELAKECEIALATGGKRGNSGKSLKSLTDGRGTRTRNGRSSSYNKGRVRVEEFDDENEEEFEEE